MKLMRCKPAAKCLTESQKEMEKTGLCEINQIDRNFNKFPTAGVMVVRKKKTYTYGEYSAASVAQ